MVDRAAQKGFTLLEILVALLVLAIAMTALIKASGHRARVQADLSQLTLANWVAANAIEEVKLQDPFPNTGSRSGRSRMGQLDWSWQMEIVQTEDSGMRRLNVEVSLRENPDLTITRLSGFAGQ